jgi:hypothetical protein
MKDKPDVVGVAIVISFLIVTLVLMALYVRG